MIATIPWTCPSCHDTIRSPYCPRCGERPLRPGELTLRGLVEQAFEALTSIDGRVLRSFRALISSAIVSCCCCSRCSPSERAFHQHVAGLPDAAVPVQVHADVLLQAADHFAQQRGETFVLPLQLLDAGFERLRAIAVLGELALLIQVPEQSHQAVLPDGRGFGSSMMTMSSVATGPKSREARNHPSRLRPFDCARPALIRASVPHPTA
jgi:hypothetical protein